jgi:Protein of unknown function (DUF2726)
LYLLGAILAAVVAFWLGYSTAPKGKRAATETRREIPHFQPRPSSGRVFQIVDADRPLVAAGGVANPLNQMEFVSRVEFETVKLLNREEYPLLVLLEKLVDEVKGGRRVMAQTSLGEILRPKQTMGSADERSGAFSSINSKRLDFAIFDRYGFLVLAIEYQGSGHYSQKAFIRDAVKKEALRKAGVPFLEVPLKFEPDTVRREVLRHLRAGETQAQSAKSTGR